MSRARVLAWALVAPLLGTAQDVPNALWKAPPDGIRLQFIRKFESQFEGGAFASKERDSREIEGEILLKVDPRLAKREGENSEVTIRRIKWTYSNLDCEVSLSTEDLKNFTEKIVRVKSYAEYFKSETLPQFAKKKEEYEKEVREKAEGILSQMKKLCSEAHGVGIMGHHFIYFYPRKGRRHFGSGSLPELLDDGFIHTPLPPEGLRDAASWEVPLDPEPILATPYALLTLASGVKKPMAMKCQKKGDSFLATGVVTWDLALKPQKQTGTQSERHELCFSTEGFLQSARRELKSTCKQNDRAHLFSLVQSITLLKK